MINDPENLKAYLVSADVPDDRGFEDNPHDIKNLNDWNVIAEQIAKNLNERGV